MAVVVSCYWLGARGIGIDYCTIVLTCKNVRAVAHVHTAGMTFGTSSIGFDRPTAHNMQRKRHPSLEARRVARIGTTVVCLLRLLCVYFCRVFSVHSSTFYYTYVPYAKPWRPAERRVARIGTSLFAVAALSLFLSCFLGSLQYFLSNISCTQPSDDCSQSHSAQ